MVWYPRHFSLAHGGTTERGEAPDRGIPSIGKREARGVKVAFNSRCIAVSHFTIAALQAHR
jgi:hypothetical protein